MKMNLVNSSTNNFLCHFFPTQYLSIVTTTKIITEVQRWISYNCNNLLYNLCYIIPYNIIFTEILNNYK